MKEKRGLFEAIFGRKPQELNGFTTYQLLSTFQSNFVPFSGNAWDVSTVRAAVHAFARRAAVVKPRHVRKGDGAVTEQERSAINRILQFSPNQTATAYKLYYRAAVQYKLYNNAFLFPVWSVTGNLEALYNVNAHEIQLLEKDGELYCKFKFYNGRSYVFPYVDFAHISSMNADNDIFGSGNEAIMSVLKTADTFNQSMSKFAELVAVVRGILDVAASTKDEDLTARRDKFVRDNLKMDSNGAGVIVTDNKYKYTPITEKQTPLPTGQLEYIKGEIYDYFGVNEKIVQNKATPEEEDDFYEGEIKPFHIQLGQALTNCLFTSKERGYGNEIVVEGSKLQYAKLSDKLAAIKYLSDIGAVTIDQALVTLGYPPIGGDEGRRRVQSLNMVNAAKADEYQVGDSGAGKKDKSKGKDEPEGGTANGAGSDDEKDGEEENNDGVQT